MSRPVKFYLIRTLQLFIGSFFILAVALTILFFIVSAPPSQQSPQTTTVNDVTGLNPIIVDHIYRPENTDEIIELVKNWNGPISIGGARHSMGGQIGAEQSLHLDMRGFDDVISFSKEKKEITVQTGITWRKIQEYIDPHDLSVMIMQTYANFTVGGSLSVNVHGRYIGQGPIIHSVKSIKVVLPDGNLVVASPDENTDIFYGCIGGYGGLGVIVEATLYLEDNVKVARQSLAMPLKEYYHFFQRSIRNDSTVIFHNADIYTDNYNSVRALSYVKTDKPLTITDRLKPTDRNYRVERFAMWVVSEMPYGTWIRKNWGDPLFYDGPQVKWRNYEASYDAFELEPTSRENSTYVLQEYFVPVERLDSFVPAMAGIFQKHQVNIINISIRHARKDKGSLLAWAPTEVFCLVVYYKQDTTPDEKQKVAGWTRELIDAAIAEGGSYYLPYQIHATPSQFLRSYPHADRFFELKKKLDPTNKFRNKLWDAYYKP